MVTQEGSRQTGTSKSEIMQYASREMAKLQAQRKANGPAFGDLVFPTSEAALVKAILTACGHSSMKKSSKSSSKDRAWPCGSSSGGCPTSGQTLAAATHRHRFKCRLRPFRLARACGRVNTGNRAVEYHAPLPQTDLHFCSLPRLETVVQTSVSENVIVTHASLPFLPFRPSRPFAAFTFGPDSGVEVK